MTTYPGFDGRDETLDTVQAFLDELRRANDDRDAQIAAIMADQTPAPQYIETDPIELSHQRTVERETEQR